MTSRILLPVLAIGCVGLLVAGCRTTPEPVSLGMTEVHPAPNQSIVLDRIVILADASGSLSDPSGFRLGKALIQEFVAGMPTGHYDVALDSFSGSDRKKWMWNPLLPFDRTALATDAEMLSYIGETTRFDLVLTYSYRIQPRSSIRAQCPWPDSFRASLNRVPSRSH